MINLNKVGFLKETKCEYAKKVLKIEENTESAVDIKANTKVKAIINRIFPFCVLNKTIARANINAKVAIFPMSPFAPCKNGILKVPILSLKTPEVNKNEFSKLSKKYAMTYIIKLYFFIVIIVKDVLSY
jgi:hypothetical protein